MIEWTRFEKHHLWEEWFHDVVCCGDSGEAVS